MPSHVFVTLAIFSAILSPNRPVSVEGTMISEEPPSTLPALEIPFSRRAEKVPHEVTAEDREAILWLARIVYTETKIEPEMRLVAWVVRNRVVTGFRGTNYKEVALSKNQFSGLSKNDPNYWYHVSLDYSVKNNRSWTQALTVAEEVYFADESERPFPQTVRHFYSPIAITPPSWADANKLYHTIALNSSQPARFAFYINVH